MANLLLFDNLITKFLANLIPHNQFFNYFFSFFSLKGNSIFVWILVIIITLILEEKKHPGLSKRDKKFLLLFSLAFLGTALFVTFPLKNLFERLRPITATAFQCPSDYSFPSGHTATAFAAASILNYFDKKRKWFYYVVALLISFSRIYLGCHYFLDVITGAIIGDSISRLLLFVHDTYPFRKKN